MFASTSSTFFLRNSNDAGFADLTFPFNAGSASRPVAGDWNANGVGTIGLYNSSTSTFFLRNSNNAGSADLTFRYGQIAAGWLPIAGDWNAEDGLLGAYTRT